MSNSYCVHEGEPFTIFHYENNFEEATISISSSIHYGRKMNKGEYINYRYIYHNVKLIFINLDEINNYIYLNAINSLLKVFLQGKLKHGKELKIKIPNAEDTSRELYCKHANRENDNSYIEIGIYDKSYTNTREKSMMKMHIAYAHSFFNATNKAMVILQPNPYIIWEG
jgi:hypothetical protein